MKITVKIAAMLGVVCLSVTTFGQTPKPVLDETKKLGEAVHTEIQTATFIGERHPISADLDWVPTLTHLPEKIDHSTPDEELIEAMKIEKTAVKTAPAIGLVDDEEGIIVDYGSQPVLGNNFNGNPNFGSSPMDNDLAISNNGIIVTVANSTVQYKTESGSTTFSSSLATVIDDPTIENICDPLVHYDPGADRFIMFAQECSGNSSNSFLLILFSQTNDPADGWNYYKITGNPLSDNSWFDYPKMAVSQNELFITGNLFSNSSVFRESVVYQIDKNDGFDGNPLTWQLWSDISANPFTLLPVSSGSEVNYGPGIYLVSTRASSGSTIRFYDITADIGDSPSMNYYSVPTTPYSVAGDAFQSGTSCRLNQGDCRALSGFYQANTGTLHFVFHSEATGGWNGINYNRLDVSALENTSSLYAAPGDFDFAFPSIAWYGISDLDEGVMIGYGAADNSIFPEMRVVHVNHGGEWSEETVVKEGEGFACYTNPTRERWGDYTGMARKHNSPSPSVWTNGMYGRATNVWWTRISEIHLEFTAGLDQKEPTSDLNVAPNPVFDAFSLTFSVEETTPVNIRIIGMDGKVVKELYTGMAYAGNNEFGFNKANLARGTYFVQVSTSSKKIVNETIVIQ